MTMELPRIIPTAKSGDERFRVGAEALPIRLHDFWRWCCSDLLSNATRGILGEFIVARLIGDASTVRDEWGAWDLNTPEGIKVEVKSSAFIQSWRQAKPSAIKFGAAATWAWDPDTNLSATAARRQADVYVFALLDGLDQERIDPLNLDQWRFFVVATHTLDERLPNAKSVSLDTFRRLDVKSVGHDALAEAVRRAGGH